MSPLRDQRGNAAIELVLVAPVLLLMLSLVVGAGRLVGAKSAIEQVAREAGRAAAAAPDLASALSAANQRAKETAGEGGLDPLRIEVLVSAGNFARGEPIKVSASYKLRLSDLPLLGFAPGSVILSAEHVEIAERYGSR